MLTKDNKTISMKSFSHLQFEGEARSQNLLFDLLVIHRLPRPSPSSVIEAS
jgi:hypothetical protein